MNANRAVVSVLMLMCGCATIPLTDPTSLQKYDDILACAREAEKKAVRANCSERFKNTEITGELEKLELSLGMPKLRLKVRGIDYLLCDLEGPQDRNQLAALDPGDLVTIQGTPVDAVRVTGSAYLDVITFKPCVLIPSRKRDLYVPG